MTDRAKQRDTLIVFDIDGTLTDTVPLHKQAFSSAIYALGITEFDDDYGGYLHHTDSYIFKTIFDKHIGLPVTQPIMQTFENYLTAHFKLATVSKPIEEIAGAALAVAQLQQNGNYAVAFATGSLAGPAVLKLVRTGIQYVPELLVAANELLTRDEIVLTAIRNAEAYYSRSFRRIISVGDGIWDMKTAFANGMEFVGIGRSRFAALPGVGLSIDDFSGTSFFNYL